MNLKSISIFILIFSLFISPSFSQEKSKRELRKEQKEKEKVEKEKQTEALIEAKSFMFIAKRALPTGARSIDLTGDNYFVKFESNLIESVLPFFGRAFAGAGFGNDNGMRFKGEPKTFKIKKAKKNYEIEAVVEDNNDTYNLTLTVSFQGSASLFITSNNRNSISYQGQLEPIKKEAEKE
jgi:hypothetical protein